MGVLGRLRRAGTSRQGETNNGRVELRAVTGPDYGRKGSDSDAGMDDGGPEGECLPRATQRGFTSPWYQFCFCDIVSLVRMSMHGRGHVH